MPWPTAPRPRPAGADQRILGAARLHRSADGRPLAAGAGRRPPHGTRGARPARHAGDRQRLVTAAAGRRAEIGRMTDGIRFQRAELALSDLANGPAGAELTGPSGDIWTGSNQRGSRLDGYRSARGRLPQCGEGGPAWGWHGSGGRVAGRLGWDPCPQRPREDPEPDRWVQQHRFPVDADLHRCGCAHLEAGVGPLGPAGRAAGPPEA